MTKTFNIFCLPLHCTGWISFDTIRNNKFSICIRFIAFSGHNTKLAAPSTLTSWYDAPGWGHWTLSRGAGIPWTTVIPIPILSLLDMMRHGEGVEGDARLWSFGWPCPLTEGGKLFVAILLNCSLWYLWSTCIFRQTFQYNTCRWTALQLLFDFAVFKMFWRIDLAQARPRTAASRARQRAATRRGVWCFD